MEFRILGSIEVVENGGVPIALGGPKQRAVLAHLLLRANPWSSGDGLRPASRVRPRAMPTFIAQRKSAAFAGEPAWPLSEIRPCIFS